jgi:hypothetical protein
MTLALEQDGGELLTQQQLHLLAQQQQQQQQQQQDANVSSMAEAGGNSIATNPSPSSSSSSYSDVPVVISSLTKTYLEDLVDQVCHPTPPGSASCLPWLWQSPFAPAVAGWQGWL